MGLAKGYLLAIIALAVLMTPVVTLACLPGAPVGFSGGAAINPTDELPGGG
jgi:hypothetical protein